MLPRWSEAFRDAIGLRFGEKASPASKQTIAWVRIQSRSAKEAIEAVRCMLGNDVACIVLADVPDDELAMSCLSAAARGFCNTHATPILLRRVADVVTQGGLWVGESLMQRIIRATQHIPAPTKSVPDKKWDDELTKREREVAVAVAAGGRNKEIARSLGVSERTIKAHVGAILDKFEVRDRLQLSLIVNGQRAR